MRKIYCLVAFALGLASASCSSSNEESTPTPSIKTGTLSVKFVYDYNMSFANTIAQISTSANVWAFDAKGNLAWSGVSSAADFAKDGFCLKAQLPDGDYDLVAWCGLEGNEAVELADYKPMSKEELSLSIKTHTVNGLLVSDICNPGIYYASVSGVKVKSEGGADNAVTLSLMKDTNDFIVKLQHADGTAVDMNDFTVSITDDNGKYAWNNSLVQSTAVSYFPWSAGSEGYRLTTGRLMQTAAPRMSVTGKSDGRKIVDIPLLNYLLMIKGNYGDLSNQEFLDRMDSYSISFFLDESDNWLNSIVSINGFTIRFGSGSEL